MPISRGKTAWPPSDTHQISILVLLFPESAELTHLQQVVEVHDALNVIIFHLPKENNLQ